MPNVYPTAALLTGCSNDGGGGEGDTPFVPPAAGQLTQSAYADQEATGPGFVFTANAAWSAEVREKTEPANFSSDRGSSRLSVVPPPEEIGNQVVWLRLYNGTMETYSGIAGTVSLRIETDQNYTGVKREAAITVRSGNNSFTVSVVQEGTKQGGGENPAPVPVETVTLSRGELSLDKGESAKLTAEVSPADATIKSVSWSSSDPRVVYVHPVTGQITARAEGSATITATSSSNKTAFASCLVEVEDVNYNVKTINGASVHYSPANYVIGFDNTMYTDFLIKGGALGGGGPLVYVTNDSWRYEYTDNKQGTITLQYYPFANNPNYFITEYIWGPNGELSNVSGDQIGTDRGEEALKTDIVYGEKEYLLGNLDINLLLASLEYYGHPLFVLDGNAGEGRRTAKLLTKLIQSDNSGKYGATKTYRYTFDTRGRITEIHETVHMNSEPEPQAERLLYSFGY